jgi:hypothetical protein
LKDLGFRHVYYTSNNGLCYEEFNWGELCY